MPLLVGAVAATATVVVRQLLALRNNAALLDSVREHQRLLHEQASHDALTGLPNRMLFNDTLEEASTAMRSSDDEFAVLLRSSDDEFPVLLRSSDDADGIAERILAEIAVPIATHGHVLTVTPAWAWPRGASRPI